MDVTYVANLARLALTPEEAERYQRQLDQVLEYMNQLDKVDVSGIEPTAHATPVFDVLRDDLACEDSLSPEEALSNAPEIAQRQFKVVKVVE